ncbi:MAG: D-alanyl-D-alanine carboxypeptidase/D-alanyl-D-alanine-endopeptidase [Geminicoccaceae bacterium]
MLEFVGGARAAIAMLLLLGACAGGAAPPATLSLPEPAAGIAPDDGIPAGAIPRSGGTEIGYLLLDLETGEELSALNADLPLIPASTVKLATAVVALDVLGPEHRYRTELLTDGVTQDGVLRGDLILKGGGDPSLDVADLLELAARLQASGVRSVEGRFLIDDTALPRISEIEPTQPLEAAYNPGIGALSVAFNRVRVSLRGGASVMTLPPLDAQFEAAPSSLLPPGGVELKSADGDEVVWRVADRGGRRREIEIPVKDPGLHAGHVFRWLALAQGVYVGPPQRGIAPPRATLLAVHESAPLRSLLRDTLLYSNNMMAEMIGLSAAGRLGDASSGPGAAGSLLLRHLARLMPAVDWRGAVIGNCSGLDGTARLTPRQLAAIARYGWRTQALAALLPGGGWSGTLTDRFDESGEALRVWAKTGTLNYGAALAGYLLPEVGRPAVFVTMVSDVGARAAYDALSRPGRAAEAVAGAWNSRARALEDELVEGWLEPLPTS